MFYKTDNVYEYFEEKLMKKERKRDMALIDLIPGAIEIFRDEGRKEGKIEGELKAKRSTIKRILTKKLKVEPANKIIKKLEKLTIKDLEEIEDRIFEIEEWEEIFNQ